MFHRDGLQNCFAKRATVHILLYMVSLHSNNDTISQNKCFAKRLNHLAKVILFGKSPYYLAKLEPFGKNLYTIWQNSKLLAKVYAFSQKFYLIANQWGRKVCIMPNIVIFYNKLILVYHYLKCYKGLILLNKITKSCL